jgi:hypothetical protein
MCIACEMGFWDMVDALPPETRERVLREEAARLNAPFACDEPEATPAPGEHKP